MRPPEFWQPAAHLDTLRQRARLLARVRNFFAMRDVLEVETPVLAPACAPETHIEPFYTEYHGPGGARRLFLQASPELAMKRLLAAGSGPIYQISRVFRDGESGRWHNPEFSLLEWYRPGYDHHRLMDEMDELLQELLDSLDAERVRYADIFELETQLHPLHAELGQLQEYAVRVCDAHDPGLDRDTCLNLIFSHQVEPTLGHGCPTFVYDFPASQASLARVCPERPEYAERFEVYLDGVELANGFHELSDPLEQRARFETESATRQAKGGAVSPLDLRFLAALESGLPDCAGVALGLDRLLMLLTKTDHIDRVLAFPLGRA